MHFHELFEYSSYAWMETLSYTVFWSSAYERVPNINNTETITVLSSIQAGNLT